MPETLLFEKPFLVLGSDLNHVRKVCRYYAFYYLGFFLIWHEMLMHLCMGCVTSYVTTSRIGDGYVV